MFLYIIDYQVVTPLFKIILNKMGFLKFLVQNFGYRICFIFSLSETCNYLIFNKIVRWVCHQLRIPYIYSARISSNFVFPVSPQKWSLECKNFYLISPLITIPHQLQSFIHQSSSAIISSTPPPHRFIPCKS